MLSLSKKIFVEYRSLVVKMVHDNVVFQTTKVNYELLCDVETFLGLACIMPLLEIMQGLSKFMQGRQNLTCNFVSIVKLVKANVQHVL
jgi:hypothetical protein